MPTVQVKGVANPIQFPDDMDINNIREVLRQKFTQRALSGESDILSPVESTVSTYSPSLVDKIGSGIASGLTNTGLISDNYRAQQIGKNVSALGEFLPGIGDATAGDEFGRAVAEGDNLGMGLAALGAIPIAGDALKKVFKGSNPVNIHDTIRNRFKRSEKVVNLPQGNVGSNEFDRIKSIDPKAKVLGKQTDGAISISYLDEYKPKQLKGALHEFDPDALEVTENTTKRTDNFKGDTSKPIAVTKKDGDFFILDGHHRVKLAKEKGENVNAIVIPVDDVQKMKEKGLNQADMLEEWNKGQSLPMDEFGYDPVN